MDRKCTVLIVESDAEQRERLGAALERGGYDVVLCSGPTGPGYVCIGSERAGARSSGAATSSFLICGSKATP